MGGGMNMRALKFRAFKLRYWDSVANSMKACSSVTAEMLGGGAGIMEWSGLLDKNGVEIYEGDLIQLDEKFAQDTGASQTLCMVGFDQGTFRYGRSRMDPTVMNTNLWVATEMRACAVVGNVFQMPNWAGPPDVSKLTKPM
jgi:hypothetical protein